MGVPVVTLKSKNNHAHNVGSTLLTAIGYESLIASTKEDYIKKAIDLATDVTRLINTRKTLREQMGQSDLCNGHKFTQNLEVIYRDTWKKYIKDQKSD